MPPRRRAGATGPDHLTDEQLAELTSAVADGRRATVYLIEGIPSLGIAPGASARAVSVAGRTVELTPTEFALLRYLASHAEHPVSKEELLQEVWGYADASSQNLVELAARRLRTKIETDPSAPTRLVTVRSVGYRYEVQEPQAEG